jgi:Lrp/AsnC family transcriptional regulator for asnA, asnC and gidA
LRTLAFSLNGDVEVDRIDYLVLSELLKDAQLPFSAIAKKLGISAQTVKNRYEKMKDEGIVSPSVISLDLSKLGYQGKAFLMITTSPETKKSEIINSVKKISDIIVVSEIIGFCDILAIASIRDIKGMSKIVNEVRDLSGVERVEVTITDDTSFPVKKTYQELFSQRSHNLANI